MQKLIRRRKGDVGKLGGGVLAWRVHASVKSERILSILIRVETGWVIVVLVNDSSAVRCGLRESTLVDCLRHSGVHVVSIWNLDGGKVWFPNMTQIRAQYAIVCGLGAGKDQLGVAINLICDPSAFFQCFDLSINQRLRNNESFSVFVVSILIVWTRDGRNLSWRKSLDSDGRLGLVRAGTMGHSETGRSGQRTPEQINRGRN